MRSFKNSAGLLATILVSILISCTESTVEPSAIDKDTAAEDIGASLVTDLGFVTNDVSILLLDAANGRSSDGRIEACGITYDSTIMRSYDGSYVTAESSYSYSYSLVCDGIIPSSFGIGMTGSSTKTTERLSSESSLSGQVTVTGILPGDDNYIIDGSLTRNASLFTNEKEFSSSSHWSLDGLLVTKVGAEINGGSVTFIYAATLPDGTSNSYQASIEFLGDGLAELILDDSHTYHINLETGEISKVE